MRKAAFDQAPARGEIRIAIAHGPDRVKVIRQDHGDIDRKGMSCPHLAKRARNTSMWSVNSAHRRSARLTVKK